MRLLGMLPAKWAESNQQQDCVHMSPATVLAMSKPSAVNMAVTVRTQGVAAVQTTVWSTENAERRGRSVR